MSSTDADVMLMPLPKIQVTSFAISVPVSTTIDTVPFDDDFYMETVGAAMQQVGITSPNSSTPLSSPLKTVNTEHPMEGIGMVGTITFLKTSIIIWFGWGKTTAANDTNSTNETSRDGVNHSQILGSLKGTKSSLMGHLIVAMPPRKYGSHAAESSTSKLIGGEFQDDETVAKQMACRLSQKCHMPVMVSCHLDPALSQQMGLHPDMLHARAAALAEQRIWELVKTHTQQKQQQAHELIESS